MMERLTRKVDGKTVFPSELVGVTLTPDNVVLHELLCRLADYEDTGLTPEQCENAKVIIEAAFSDVAPVVRCKNCKYSYSNSFSAASGVALCTSSGQLMQQDDFCSYGERKDGSNGT